MINNKINFNKAHKVHITGVGSTPESTVAGFMVELASLGYTMSTALIERLMNTDESTVTDVYHNLITSIEEELGSNKKHVALFGRFPIDIPTDVLQNLNRISYIAEGLGESFKFNIGASLTELEYVSTLKTIDLASEITAFELFGNLAGSKVSLSIKDRELITSFITENKNAVLNYIPDVLSNKENMAVLVVALLRSTDLTTADLSRHLKTATDILRVAAELSGGDSTLKTKTKFKLKNSERNFIMGALNEVNSPEEDMLRHKSTWIRLAEVLHTGSFKNRFPNTFKSVQILRENKKVETFNSNVEARVLVLINGNQEQVMPLIELLKTRPGDFARRLDMVLSNVNDVNGLVVTESFIEVIGQVSTNVLLKLRSHLSERAEKSAFRYFIPKGNCCKLKMFWEDTRNTISRDIIDKLTKGITDDLQSRFSEKCTLGKTFIHTDLNSILVPLVQRDIAEGTMTLPRGSRIKLDESTKFIRPFLFWEGRGDIDISIACYGSDWNHVADIAYYNLSALGKSCQHSGDIISGIGGASEFIDFNIDEAISNGVRYITMCVNDYSGKGFNLYDKCFAGFQERENQTGDNYEPRTVKQKYDLVSESKFNVPVVFDLESREMIWADMSISAGVGADTNSETVGIRALSIVCESMINNNPRLVELLLDHTETRSTDVVIGGDAELEVFKASLDEVDGNVETHSIFDLSLATDFNKISTEFL